MLNGKLKIIAYEFYFRDPVKGYEFLGILPERRTDGKRVNKDSIRRWGTKLTGRSKDSKWLCFTKVIIDRDKNRIIRPNVFV
jgi:hypothetical protein